jgi:hypothetical protein
MSAFTWSIAPIRSPTTLIWGGQRRGHAHQCPNCHITLLTGETPGFCCGPGGKFLNATPPLPPLPEEIEAILDHPHLSRLSRRLNLIFSFAMLETTHAFPTHHGPHGFLAIQGRIYHRICPMHENSAVRWLLYDGNLAESTQLPHQQQRMHIPAVLINAVCTALLRINPLTQALRALSAVNPTLYPSLSLVLSDSGAANEIAALISFENTTSNKVQPRRIVITRSNGRDQYISAFSRLWEPLSYPLLFPHGTLGWGKSGVVQDITSATAPVSRSMTNIDTNLPRDDAPQMWHYRALLLREPRFRIFGRLTNEFVVDMFSRNLELRLKYIRQNKNRLRAEESALMGSEDISDSDNVYLPASFLGSKRWAAEQVADSLAIAAEFGPPTFFITMTCNAKWPEITSQLLRHQTVEDRPELVCRVFRRKLALLLTALKSMFPHAGGLLYQIHSIEFQKRGLPHAHILVKYTEDCIDAESIDAVISAELPKNPADRQLVTQFMIHHHSAPPAPISAYCQREDMFGNRYCRFHYPKDIQQTTEINEEGRVCYRRRTDDDVYVVPYNLQLLQKFHCHINFEAANSSHLFQYLFKYIHKGIFQRNIQ